MSRFEFLIALIVATLSGSLSVLAFAPVRWWYVLPLTLAVLFYILNRARGLRRVFYLALAFNFAFFSAGLWWIYQALTGYIGLPVTVGAPLAVLFYAFLALFPAVGLAVGWLWGRRESVWRLLCLATAWALAEWFRGWLILGGFPWLAAGYSQIPHGWFSGWVSVLGIFGVSWAVAVAAVCVVLPWVVYRKRFILASPLIIAMLAALPWVINNSWSWTQQSGDLEVSVLQGNVKQALKWKEGEVERALKNYLQMADSSTGQVIILPETALPMRLADLPPDYLQALRDIAQARNGVMMAGVFLPDEKTDGLYNGVQVFARNDLSSYRKQHLTPYGEYIPMAALLTPLLRRAHIPYHGLLAGTSNKPIELTDNVMAGVSICYEDAFGEEWRGQYADAQLLVNVTNDAWFGDSKMPAQHLQIAQARALESGRWLVRASNSGESAVIDHRGGIVRRLPADIHGVLTHRVDLHRGKTAYTILGDRTVVVLMFLLLVLPRLGRWRQYWKTKHSRNEQAEESSKRRRAEQAEEAEQEKENDATDATENTVRVPAANGAPTKTVSSPQY